jgi:dihydroorotate dehydrogenase
MWKRAERWPRHPVGINLGKSKITPLEGAAEDYANSFRLLRPLADFFVVNVSSPNTPNLRQLQDKAALDEILAALQQQQVTGDGKPIFVKVAPDLTFEALDEILELVGPRGLAGVVATNTTINRPETSDPELRRTYAETGGLSGKPLQKRSTDVIRHLYRQTQGKLFIIVLGEFSPCRTRGRRSRPALPACRFIRPSFTKAPGGGSTRSRYYGPPRAARYA